jgi:hypothetical protein
MSTRSDRRKEAAESRKEMKLYWLELARRGVADGKSVKDALFDAAKVVNADIKKQPHLKSQIQLAWIEFCNSINAAIKATNATDSRQDPQATAG